jgi:predicted  nucleic acid-binding Zn-ribbon protein
MTTTLEKFNANAAFVAKQLDEVTNLRRTNQALRIEVLAAYERIEELKSSLAEMLSIYWGKGDGQEPLPACILRAEAALADEVVS